MKTTHEEGGTPSLKTVDPREFDLPSEDAFRIYGVSMETKLIKPNYYEQHKQQSRKDLLDSQKHKS